MKTRLDLIFALLLGLSLVACQNRQVEFASVGSDEVPSDQDIDLPGPPCPKRPCDGNTVESGHDVFFQTRKDGRVDILVVDDNSGSMEVEQRMMGDRFNSFVTGLGDLDWQIAITTTDVSNGPHGLDGSILQMTGFPGRILDPSTPDADIIFKNTVARPETVNCAPANCPSGHEQPLFASIRAMEKRNSDNVGLFRDGSDLAIVILSDEDELSTGPTNATQPQYVIDKFQSIWGPEKKLSVYGIIVEPGDSRCLNLQRGQTGNTAHYGHLISNLSNKTGGITGSICDTDYSQTLEAIGKNVKDLIESVELSHVPIPDSVQVTLDPADPNVQWVVKGNKVLFDPVPEAGTRIDVDYKYLK